MKFIVSSTALSQRMQVLGRVISGKNALPIQSCFLFCIENGTLTLTASDSEVEMTAVLELVETECDIRFAVNAKTVMDAIKEIPEQPLAFYVKENLEITVEYLNGRYNFVGKSADEYPVTPAIEDGVTTLTLSCAALTSGIGRALFATADDTYRMMLNGIYFDILPETLAMVASDGQKLACCKTKSVSIEGEGAFILPKKPAALLRNALAKEEGEAVIAFNERNASVTTENYRLTCRLIEGRYPNYNSVIPQNNPNIATIDRAALISAIRRVLVFSNATTVLIKLHFAAGRLTLSTQDIDYSTSAEESLLCDYTGNPLSIGFKGTFLTELLNNIESDEVMIKLADASRAGIIVPAEQESDEDILMLLMPMILND